MSKKAPFQAKIIGITLNSTSLEEVLIDLISRLKSGNKTLVTTPNPEFVIFAHKNPWFKKILNQADIAIPDGMGLVWAGKILNQPIEERVSGTDLMERLCREAAKEGWTTYFLGGKPRIANKTLKMLKKSYPGLRGWAEAGPNLPSPPRLPKTPELIKRINRKKPDLLFVAFGMGKQEKFIADNWKKLNVKLAIGIGGAFDYLSGEVKRAPKWMQGLGLEWLYRLFQEPWRWRRQLVLLEFIWLVFKEKLSSK